MHAKVYQISSSSSLPKTDPHRDLIRKTKASLNFHLSNLISKIFSNGCEALSRSAENTYTLEERALYFGVMQTLNNERQKISKCFAEAFRAYLIPLELTQNSKDHASENEFDDELTLIGQEEMEEMVTINTISRKATEKHREAISHLEARLEFLALKTSSIFSKDALSPKHICEAFHSALNDLGLDIKHKLIVYKLFEFEVALKLDTLYDALNILLIEEGVLPQIKLSSSQRGMSEYTNPPNLIYSTSGYNAQIEQPYMSTGYSVTTPPRGNHLEGIINHYLGIGAAKTTQNSRYSNQFYNHRDMLAALSDLQAQYNPCGHSKVDAQALKQALLTTMNAHTRSTSKQVNPVDEKTIDFVGLLFDAILEDNQVSGALKSLLLKLQIPMIKVAIIDPKFFTNKRHPAREFLDSFVMFGIEIHSETDVLYDELKHIENHLLEHFDNNIDSFNNALYELKKLIKQEDERARSKEQQTQKRILHDHIRQVVLQELRSRTTGKILPNKAHPLILKLWPSLMFNHYLKHGKDSRQWQLTIDVLDRLIASVQPISSYQALNHLVGAHEKLMAAVDNLLREVNHPREDIQTVLNTLQDTYIELIDSANLGDEEKMSADAGQTNNLKKDSANRIKSNTRSAESSFDNTSPKAIADITGVSFTGAEKTLHQAKLERLPKVVRPGVWFELDNGNDRPPRRLKLSVILVEESKLIFVNRHGEKILEKDVEAFVKELEENRSRIIADHSLFDHALSTVITSLTTNSR